jgi:hypothetical protein
LHYNVDFQANYAQRSYDYVIKVAFVTLESSASDPELLSNAIVPMNPATLMTWLVMGLTSADLRAAIEAQCPKMAHFNRPASIQVAPVSIATLLTLRAPSLWLPTQWFFLYYLSITTLLLPSRQQALLVFPC